MQTYSFLRELADSWVLLAMFSFFIGAILWAFRPGSTAHYASVSAIPLRDEAAPKPDEPCGGDCTRCACSTGVDFLKGTGNV